MIDTVVPQPLQVASSQSRAHDPAGRSKGGGNRTTVRISSEQLFAGANEVHIEHRGTLYRLQQTSLGKLILTK